MAGGLLQLLAYGAEDIYLTGNPQITFFKIVYRRHSNFSQEAFELTILDKPNFGKISKLRIFRLGDLLTKMYLKVDIATVPLEPGQKFAWVRRLGHALLTSVSVEIGGVIIDKQYGEWLDVWFELARKPHTERGYLNMIGDVEAMTQLSSIPKPQYSLFIPLKFWFNRFVGLALPLIAIQYHEIYMNFEFAPREKLVVRNANFTAANISTLTMLGASILADYTYLDSVEREKFASSQHEYLIEQVQYPGEISIQTMIQRIQLAFNHPTKELIWFMKSGNYTTGTRFLCYTNANSWIPELQKCSKELLLNSVTLLRAPIYERDAQGNIVYGSDGRAIIVVPGEAPPAAGTWEEFQPLISFRNSTPDDFQVTLNGKIKVNNNSTNRTLWVNTDSLIIAASGYSLTDKISATIKISSSNLLRVSELITEITERDISIPIARFVDTRVANDDVFVNQFNNYGIFISGRVNPIESTKLTYNEYERFEKRNSKFFGVLQPYMHHSNTPADGINVYSFSLTPEQLQPTGVSNLSKIDRIIITLWFEDVTQTDTVPVLDIFNASSRFYIFCYSYNVFRVANGLTGLAYNG
jgi:hypothetical protein